jgi:HK97 family phage prohead protease
MAQTHNRPPATEGARDLQLASRAAPIVDIDDGARTVDVIWTAGASGLQYDWTTGRRYMEELVVSERSVRLGRLNAGGPVLDNHNRYGGLNSMLAVIERAWIADGKGYATVRFPKAEDDPEADKVFRKVKDKIIRNLSTAYQYHKVEVDRSKDPEVWRVVDWEPFEISFVPIPFDTQAQVRSEQDRERTYRCLFAEAALPASAAAARARMRQRMARA